MPVPAAFGGTPTCVCLQPMQQTAAVIFADRLFKTRRQGPIARRRGCRRWEPRSLAAPRVLPSTGQSGRAPSRPRKSSFEASSGRLRPGGRDKSVQCNGELVGPDHAEHLDPNQAIGEIDRVPSIDCEGVDGLQPGQRTLRPRRGKQQARPISATAPPDSTPRKHIAFRQMLVFDGDSRRAVNPTFLERPEAAAGSERPWNAYEEGPSEAASAFRRLDRHCHPLCHRTRLRIG